MDERPNYQPVKKIELTLAWGVNQYKVVEISNSTEVKPGKWLSEDEVKHFIARNDVAKVRCMDDSILQMVAGSAIGSMVGKVV